jgi:biotin synthase
MTTTAIVDDKPRADALTLARLEAWFALPLMDLLLEAQRVHRQHFQANAVQRAQLLSVKTGGCAEDCAYCPQSAHYQTGLEREKLMPLSEVLKQAQEARDGGASRYCMGAAWRNPSDRDLDAVCDMVKGVKALGMEACVTLGMLTPPQAAKLKDAGLDYYNHNVDTSPEYYGEVITTRTYEDRLETLQHVRDAGVHVCSGGILGMGEQRVDRLRMIEVLAGMSPQPESVPINLLVQVKGTPLSRLKQIDDDSDQQVDGIELVRTIAVTRLAMPRTMVRLSAGREKMSDELQALCFLAGANSVFWGEKLLTTKNNGAARDERLFSKLGLVPLVPSSASVRPTPGRA